MTEEDDDWQEVSNARADAIERVLGRAYENEYHAPVPFALGGNADVIAFHLADGGTGYVTAELTGKPDACYADYELMICHRTPDDWGPNVISRLARYTQEAYIGAGHTMDIGSATPDDSSIEAFIFDDFATFSLFGQDLALRVCIGITKAELEFKMKHSSEKLLARLKQRGVYPHTDLNRDSIPLDE